MKASLPHTLQGLGQSGVLGSEEPYSAQSSSSDLGLGPQLGQRTEQAHPPKTGTQHFLSQTIPHLPVCPGPQGFLSSPRIGTAGPFSLLTPAYSGNH